MDVEELPETGLVAAVLQTGLREATTKPKPNAKPAQHQAYHGAWEWLMSDEVRPFSVRWCCDVLDVDVDLARKLARSRPAAVRRKLAHAKGKGGL